MRFEFDPAKNEINRAKHGVDLVLAEQFELERAVIEVDARCAHAETRYQAIGYLTGRLHLIVFPMRGAVVRVIGLRKANAREQRKYHAQA
jgi:uncharacterized DUF497 family protein